MNLIYFVTVNYFSSNLIKKLIDSLEDNQGTKYQLFIVNNSPADGDIAKLQSEVVQVIESEDNIGFARACNLGLQNIYNQDPQAIIWLINPDAYLAENSWSQVLPLLTKHPQISILGTIIHTPNGEFWFAGGRFLTPLGAILEVDLLSSHLNKDYVVCDWVSGCSLIINCQNFSQCPQFDPHYFLYYDDVDFCQKYRNQGHLVAITQQIAVIHQPSSITNRNVSNKIQHSTYSYLYCLAKYTNKLIWLIRFFRLFIYALILLLTNPPVGKGKLAGIASYFKYLIVGQ